MFVIKKIFIRSLLVVCLLPAGLTNTTFFMHASPQRGFRYIDLPEVAFSSTVSIEEALLNRRSVRKFSDKKLTMHDISQLLWAAYGITEKHPSPGFMRGGLRTAPSAGALYPLEIYIVAGNIDGLEPGLYKYQSDQHCLEFIREGDFRNQLAKSALDQAFLTNAPALLVYTAVFKRTTEKYGDRGKERYVCADLGHSAENVYLQAVSLGLGTCVVGAFSDEMVIDALVLPPDETPLYIMPVGKPK